MTDTLDRFTGTDGADVLYGTTGADVLIGLNGDDTYFVDDPGDLVEEINGQGTDSVRASVSYVLGGNIENLLLLGTSGIGGTGNELTNLIVGNSAANLIDGGGGADTMKGGGGDDVYIVDNVADRISELSTGGTDTVRSGVSYVLPGSVERLILTGTAAISANGNSLDNILIGNSAANVLNGRGGADIMKGGAGDDSYYIDNPGDQVIELAGSGVDNVVSTISYILPDNVENLRLAGSEAAAGAGNSLANLIVGNSGNNRIDGGAGADTLKGGEGADKFILDQAAGTANADRILDFSSVDDVIFLNRAVFKGIAADGGLGTALRLGTAAADADDRIVYDQASGKLWYDPDGTGSKAAALIAQLNPGTAVAASDFHAFYENRAPVVYKGIADQTATRGEAWTYTVPSNAFKDADLDHLTYRATLAGGGALPSWLHFDGATGTFSGTTPGNWTGGLDVKVIASDGQGTAVDIFSLEQVPEFTAAFSTPSWGTDSVNFTWDDWYFHWQDSWSASGSVGPFDGSVAFSGDVQAGLKVAFQLASSDLTGSLSWDMTETKATANQVIDHSPFFIASSEISGESGGHIAGGDSANNFVNLFLGAQADFAASAGLGISLPDPIGDIGISADVSQWDLIQAALTAAFPESAQQINDAVDILQNDLHVDAQAGPDDAFTYSGDFGSISVNVPGAAADADLTESSDGHSLNVHATSDPFLTASADLGTLLAKLIGQTGPTGQLVEYALENFVFGDIDLGTGIIPGVSAGIDITPVTMSISGDLRLTQDVSVEGAAAITATSSFGETVTGLSGDKIEFDTPEGEGTFGVDVTYAPQILINSAIGLQVDGDFFVQFLKVDAYVHNDFPGIPNVDYTLLTAYEDSIGLGGTVNIPVYSNSFRIDTGGPTETHHIILPYENFRTVEGSGDSWTLTTHQKTAIGNDDVNVLVGNTYNNAMSGLGGNDTLKGLNGNDRLDGGAGNDLLLGGNGDDTVLGSAGNDTLKGESGNDIVDGGAGDDTLLGGDGMDALTGGAGNDTLKGDVGDDNLVGGIGDDNLFGGDGADTLAGGDGNDVLRGEAGDDRLIGGSGNDTIIDTDGNNYVDSGDGIDRVTTGAGNDEIHLGGGDDVFVPGGGRDLVYGGAGNDTISGAVGAIGDEGDDTLIGGTEANIMNGDFGNDVIKSGGGDDIVSGGFDNDRIYGGSGNDIISGFEGSDLIEGGSGDDILAGDISFFGGWTGILDGTVDPARVPWDISVFAEATSRDIPQAYADTFVFAPGCGNDTIIDFNSRENPTAPPIPGYDLDKIDLSAFHNIWSYDDLKFGGDTDLVLDLGNGDSITFTQYSGYYTASSFIFYNGSGADTRTGTSGDDYLDAGAQADTIIGLAGDDSYVVDNVGDVVVENSSEGFDVVISSVSYTLPDNVEGLALTGNTAINGTGNELANHLIGNTAANTLSGMAGDDFLFGDLGSDTLTGGTGEDAFVFDTLAAPGNADRITDFNVADDSIWLDWDMLMNHANALPVNDMNGNLLSQFIAFGTEASSAITNIIYDQAHGKLYWDSDGTGPQQQILLGTVAAGTALTNLDFFVFYSDDSATAQAPLSVSATTSEAEPRVETSDNSGAALPMPQFDNLDEIHQRIAMEIHSLIQGELAHYPVDELI